MKKRSRKPDGEGKNGPKLLVAMTGKASAAEATEGDKAVFDYIASLPRPQRGIAERIDALAAKTLPNLQRAHCIIQRRLRSARQMLLQAQVEKPASGNNGSLHCESGSKDFSMKMLARLSTTP